MKKLPAFLLTLMFGVLFGFFVFVSIVALPLQIPVVFQVMGSLWLTAIITIIASWVLLSILIGRKHDDIFYILMILIELGLSYTTIVNFQFHWYNPIGGWINLCLTGIAGIITFFSILKRRKS